MKTRKFFKRAFALVMSLMLVVCAVPFTASAEGNDYSGFEFTAPKDGAVYVKSYNGKYSTAYIPEKYGEYTVKGICAGMLKNNNLVMDVIIPKTVTDIDKNAFKDSLKLEAITVLQGNSVYSSVDGILCNKNSTVMLDYPVQRKTLYYTVPDGITEIGDSAFAGNKFILEVYLSKTVKKIGKDAFGGTTLQKISIPSSVTSIGAEAFASSDLESITLPSSITRIERNTFDRCTKLVSVKIPNSVTYIGQYAFQVCKNLKEITLPNKLSTIEKGTFFQCVRLKNVTIPASVKTIRSSAFHVTDMLSEVHYGGTTAMWKQIKVESGNDNLLNAVLYCNKDDVLPTTPIKTDKITTNKPASPAKPNNSDNPMNPAKPGTVVTVTDVYGSIVTEYVEVPSDETITVTDVYGNVITTENTESAVSSENTVKKGSIGRTVLISSVVFAAIAVIVCGVVFYIKKKK